MAEIAETAMAVSVFPRHLVGGGRLSGKALGQDPALWGPRMAHVSKICLACFPRPWDGGICSSCPVNSSNQNGKWKDKGRQEATKMRL